MANAAKKVAPIEISYVTPETLEYVWMSQLDMIERGMSKGQGDWASTDEMLKSILVGDSQLWTVHRNMDVIAIVVLQVRATRKMTKLFVRLIAGSGLDDWADLLIENLQRFKDEVGADCIEASTRPGLAKYLQKKGWSKKAVVVELR